jgi:transcriptional regulator with XRE-family HTH domain
MDLGLFQREVAERIGCSKAALVMWEKGHSNPEIRFWPGILRFLGYDPAPQPHSTAELLLAVRRLRGWSQRRMARFLGVDPTSIRRWERSLGRAEQHLGETVLELADLVDSKG